MGWLYLYTSTTGANKLGVQAEAETVYMSHHSKQPQIYLSFIALPHNLPSCIYTTSTQHVRVTVTQHVLRIISGRGSLYLKQAELF